MIEKYVRGANDWSDSNHVNVGLIGGAFLSLITVVLCLLPPMTIWPIIAIGIVWTVLLGVARFAPVRKQIMAEWAEKEKLNNLEYHARVLLMTYRGMPDEVKAQIQPIEYDDVRGLEYREIDKLTSALNKLKTAYDNQQRLLKEPRINQMLTSIQDARSVYEQGNESLKELA